MSPILLFVIGVGLVVAVGTALLEAREVAEVLAAEGSVAVGRKALVAGFWRVLAVTVPLAGVAVPLAWWMVSVIKFPVGVSLR